MAYLVELPVYGDAAGESVPVIKIEVRDSPEGLTKVARPGQVVARASRSLNDMLANVKPVAEAFVARLGELADPPDEIKVDFGITLSAAADVVIASTATGANFSVSLTWRRGAGPVDAG